jgi:Flp pilus assembly pilin Flp
LKKVHHDEKGAVTIETVLIIAVIALPILLFFYRFVWPQLREKLEELLEEIFGDGEGAAN